MYRTVIFDLDGTLVDSSDGIIRATEEALDILKYPAMSHAEIRSYIGPPIGNSIIERNGLGADDLEEFNRVFRDIYKNKYLMNATVYPGIMELLSDLNDRFIGIATNKRIDYTLVLLENIRISEYCDVVEGLDMKGTLKKKDLIEKCAEASGENRERIVMIGDTASDMNAAKEYGIDFIGVTYGFGFKCADDVTYGHAAENVQSLRDMLF
jgi:haloacid dehalogenase superfamily, subfamily IA, variant 1 with third motif having Dx(3-4)D or Dx(3-4)E